MPGCWEGCGHLEGHRTERSRVSRAVRAATPLSPETVCQSDHCKDSGGAWAGGPATASVRAGGGAVVDTGGGARLGCAGWVRFGGKPGLSGAFRPQISRRLSRSALAPPS